MSAPGSSSRTDDTSDPAPDPAPGGASAPEGAPDAAAIATDAAAQDAEFDRAARIAGDLRAALGPLVRRLRQFRADGELTLSQSSVLVRLDREGPATSSELAAAEGIRPQSMSAIVNALDERGLIVRDPDPSDGRRVVVSLSAAGRDGLHGARRERARRLTHAITEELDTEEQTRLAAAIPLLERITRHV